MKVKLVTDSHACLPIDFMKKENIGYLESLMIIEDKDYKELSEIDRDDFIKQIPNFDPYPKTSIGSPQHALDIFEQAIKDGYEEIFYIGVSPTISNQYNSAMIAAKKVKEKIKVNLYECGLSTASQGALVLNAVKMLKKGKNVSEVIEELDKLKIYTHTLGMSQSFEALFKTGKIQKKMSLNVISKLMKLKPMFEVILDEGVQSRGAGKGNKGALQKVYERMEELAQEGIEYDLILSDVNNTHHFKTIEEELRKIISIKDVHFWKISPVVFHSLGTESIQITISPHVN
ncbi:MAG: DegV family EDD domain-containing protein [Candidatus Heimdallarchaeota archaeon]|nr:DegV family EDD domain-containing protein [Candidatus Heimdallarchaeota archaeon]MCK4876774.1 DegV family EDD domain-containing protein [Candidatus Heimdallarchaeota archaeon]